MDDLSKTAIKAQDYIRYSTKQEVKQRELKVDEYGRIYVDKHKSTVIDHVGLATQFIKFANVTPGISNLACKIITTRLINPGISTTGIGLSVGLRDDEVIKYERDGLNRIKEFISRTSFQESVEKSNRDGMVDEAVKNLNLQGNSNSLLSDRKQGES